MVRGWSIFSWWTDEDGRKCKFLLRSPCPPLFIDTRACANISFYITLQQKCAAGRMRVIWDWERAVDTHAAWNQGTQAPPPPLHPETHVYGLFWKSSLSMYAVWYKKWWNGECLCSQPPRLLIIWIVALSYVRKFVDSANHMHSLWSFGHPWCCSAVQMSFDGFDTHVVFCWE